MQFNDFKVAVNRLDIGKRLPDAVYIHESLLSELPESLTSFLADTVNNNAEDFSWNLVKFFRRDFKIALLSYPDFDVVSYPELRSSLVIDLVRGHSRETSYAESKNPPILHRKETLVAADYPHRQKFVDITTEGEQAGLYESTSRIGFKKNWERLIAQKGYSLVDGRIVRREQAALDSFRDQIGDIEIQRHLTAVDRDKLSTPMQSLARHGYLHGDHSIFDFGCGKGHDLLELEAHGLDAAGWDPVFRPNGKKQASDIVNLGFVINVIEDRRERAATLSEAYSLANRLLVVAVMLGGEATIQKFTPYKDGVVTSRGTFQKYYAQTEIREFVETTLSTKAVAVGAGLFYVFKDELEEQEFLARRQRIKREWNQLSAREKAAPTVDHQALIEKHLDLFKDFWGVCLDYGRPPANDEFERSDEIRKIIGSHRKALHASKEYFGADDYQAAKMGRKKDLTVFLALSFFDRHRAYSRMPISLQRDIRAFFEKPAMAYDFAKQALFAISDTSLIQAACEKAHKKIDCGHLVEGHSFTFRKKYIDDLPPVLRIYVGCATQLYGDLDPVNLVKIHMTSGKLTLLIYDDFDKPLPLLKERIKIRMRDQEVDYFPALPGADGKPLYFRSRFLDLDTPEYREQYTFDSVLSDLVTPDRNGLGPSISDLKELIDRAGLMSSIRI